MLLDLSVWYTDPNQADADYYSILTAQEEERRHAMYEVQSDITSYARDNGQAEAWVILRLDELYTTFAGEWAIYLIVGASAIITAIANDDTLPWLDADVNGKTVGQRIIDRLV